MSRRRGFPGPAITPHALFHLWAAHNLERTADRALNICERVIFTVTGNLVDLDEEVTIIEDGF